MSTVRRYSFGVRHWTPPTAIMALGMACVVSFMGNLGIAADELAEENYVAQIFIGNTDGTEMRRLIYLP